MDLARDLGTRRLTWRRLAVLLGHLPTDSATVRSVHGPTADWSATEHLLAVVADLLAAANWQRAGDKKKQRPKPLPRPGDARATRRDPAEVRARLLEHRQRTRRR